MTQQTNHQHSQKHQYGDAPRSIEQSDAGDETVERDSDSDAGERVDEVTCGECGGYLKRNEDRGEIVCSDCGLVSDADRVDRGPEWRVFEPGERDAKSRVGAPTTNIMHDKGLATNIGWQDQDAAGRSLSASQRNRMNRLRKWNERSKTGSAKERNLKQALSEIQRMASALGLNQQVRETAGVLYRRCLDADLLPGRSIEGVATACLYAAARQCGVPRTLEEFYPVSRVSKDSDKQRSGTVKIDRAYRYVVEELALEMEPVDPRKYLNRFISDLCVVDEQEVRGRAEELLSAAERENLHSGRSPTSLAAGAIYAAALIEDQRVTQREVAETAGCSAVTVRNRYSEMIEAHNTEFKP